MQAGRTETPISTANRIIGTARQLFMQRGYRAVSISDIVSAAEITKPTLYYHFADKEELFVQMVVQMLHEMRERMEQATEPHGETFGKLTALVRMMMEPDLDSRMVRQETREHLSAAQQARVAVSFRQQIFDPLCSVMTYGLAQGELSGRSAEELAMLFLCFIEGFHYQNNHLPAVASAAPESPFASFTFSPEQIVQFFLHGVGARQLVG
jgi:AcrR family transcriptional regulator